MTIHARIRADNSHAVVEEAAGVPQIDETGANLIEDDGDVAWFVWADFELVAPPLTDEKGGEK